MNKHLLIGNLGKDPEVQTLSTGTKVAKFSMATTEKYKDEKQTEWHNIVAWGKLAEIVEKHFTVGMKVFVEGKSKTSTWESDGVKKYKTEVHMTSFEFLGGNSDTAPAQGYTKSDTNTQSEPPVIEDDLPF